MRRFSVRAFARISFAPLGAVALAPLCAPALAQDQETWRCDKPNGYFDRRLLGVSDETIEISGRVNVHKAYQGTRWGSGAKIAFVNSDPNRGDYGWNGIEIKAYHDPDHLEYYILQGNKPAAVISGREYETAVTFSLSIDPQGVMTARIGKQRVDVKAVPLAQKARDTIMFFCSGADVSFLNIATRSVRPPDGVSNEPAARR